MIVNNLIYIPFSLLSTPVLMAGIGEDFWEAFVSHLDWITTLLGLAYILLEYRASIWLWLVGFVMQALDIVLYYDKGLYADCGMEFYYIAMTIYGFWSWRKGISSEASSEASPDPSSGRGELIPNENHNALSPAVQKASPDPSSGRGELIPNENHKALSPAVQKNAPLPLEGSGEASGQASGEASGGTPISHFKPSLILPWTLTTLAIWAVLWYWLTQIGSTVPVADAFTTALSFVGIWALARKYLEQWLIWIVVDVVTCVLYFYKDIPFKASLYALYVVIAVFGYIKWRKMMHSETSPR